MKVGIINSASFGLAYPAHEKALASFADVVRHRFSASAKASELAATLTPYAALICGTTPMLTTDLFRALPNLSLIARHGIGTDSIDVEAATKSGILVTRIAGERERTAVAELTIALTLSLLRNLHPAAQAAHAGRWNERASFIGSEISGKTVGIIGLGNVGSRVAEIFERGFGSRVIAFDPALSTADPRKVSFEDLLTRSDIISLHCPLTPSTRRLIDSRALGRMKNSALLVNTARGELVDESALYEALTQKRLCGYAADVLSEEPPSSPPRLLELSSVLISPHLGAYTKEALTRMGDTVVAQVEAWLTRRTLPESCLNPEALQHALSKLPVTI